MPPEHPRITVVNDNPEFLELMQDVLQDATYPATLIDGGRPNAMELIEASKPDVVVLDLRMGSEQLHGLDILRQLRAHSALKDVPTIMCTADRWALDNLGQDVRSMERLALLPKPFAIADLHATIDRLLAE